MSKWFYLNINHLKHGSPLEANTTTSPKTSQTTTIPGEALQLHSTQSIQSTYLTEATNPYAIINVVIPRQDAISTREAQKIPETLAGPLRGHMKCHHQKNSPMMGITTAMFNCTTIDLQNQGVNLRPYKDFI